MLTSEIKRNRSRYIAYIESQIKHVCTSLPKREPGSEGERSAAAYFAELLKRDCHCDKVTVESFSEHPGAFYGWLYITNTLYLLAIALFQRFPLLTALLIAAGYAIDHMEFVRYRELVDKLFPKKQGHNVTAVLHPRGKVKRRLLLNGHIDAAWEWPVNYHFGGIAFEAMALLPTLGALFYFLLSVAVLFTGRAPASFSAWWYGGLVFVPFIIAAFFLHNPKHVVDGANDDLTGCYMGITLLKAMREAGIALENTEIGVVLTGSEEAGLRGAKAWAKAHRHDYDDVPTYIIAFDTIYDPRHLGVNRKDLNGGVASDRQLADLFLSAAKGQGIPCKSTRVPLMGGATDSAAFTQGGFRSIGITALNHKLEKYYHTRLDSWDNLNAEGLANCLLATAQFTEMLDAGALDMKTGP